jgi:hypothetical protein
METQSPPGPDGLLRIVSRIRAWRALCHEEACASIEASARIIEAHAPNGVVALLAKEVQVAARDLLLRRHAEPVAAMRARLDDRISRLERTIRGPA